MPFIHAGYITASGNLSYTQEPTTLNVIPLEAGIRYLVLAGNVTPYFGGGAGFYHVQEDNRIGNVSKSAVGFFGEAGLRFNLATAFFFDLRAKYTALSLRIANESKNLGGFIALAGVGFSF
jgi:opacity protein-like surface antigen